jgi:hypothetical protein
MESILITSLKEQDIGEALQRDGKTNIYRNGIGTGQYA